jgi:hypothetical protein
MRGGRWKIFKDQNHVWLEEHRVYHRDANGRVVAERTTMRFQQVDVA